MPPPTDFPVRRLRLRHLELLVALERSGTVRAAAGALSLSQPAVSKMLAEIEEAFGARMFDRSRQGMRANVFGAAAIYRAHVILSEMGRVAEDIDALRGGATAVLRLGAPSVTATVPAAIAQLRARLPGTSVHITEGRVRELIQGLLDGELDCVFGALTPELLSSDLLPLLQSEVLVQDELCVLAAATSKIARRRGLRWTDLRSAQWVVPPRDTLVRQAFMTAFLNEGVEPPEPVIEAMSSVTIGAALRMDASLLCAVRLEHARDEVARGDVRRLALQPAIALPSLGLFTRRGSVESPQVVREFAQAIQRLSRQRQPAAVSRTH